MRLDTELQNVSQPRVKGGGLREHDEWLPQKLLQGLGLLTFRRDKACSKKREKELV